MDLSRLGPGIQQVPIVPESSDPQVRVVEVIPSTASVRLEEIQDRTVPVKVNLLGNVPFGYVYGTPVVQPEVVTVNGPASLVETVEMVTVDVRVEGITVDIDAPFHPTAVDATGTAVRNVRTDPQTVRVQIPVSQQVSYKQVGVRASISGEVAPGYWIQSVNTEPSSVTVVGDPKALGTIDYLDTATLDVSNASSTITRDLRIITPDGASLIQQQTARVQVNISPLQTTQVLRVAPQLNNLGSGLQVISSPSYVDVTIQGEAPVMKSVSVDQVKVILNADGLGEGVHSVKPSVTVPAGVSVASVSPEAVTLVLGTIPTPTPIPTDGHSYPRSLASRRYRDSSAGNVRGIGDIWRNMARPIVAIVGRPNVGKSTLFNRLIGERRAIVHETAGTTRDRLFGTTEWNGRVIAVVDTGGIVFEEEGEINQGIVGQAMEAIELADTILFVVDAVQGPTAVDYDVADLLRRTDKPVLLVVNKADNPERLMNAVEFYQLGMGEPVVVSSIHGHGLGDLLDEVVQGLPSGEEETDGEFDARIAIVGRPNVGKSSLLNALAGETRSMVSQIPGTTRDALDTAIGYKDTSILLVDTAGMRRRGQIQQGIEKFSVLRAVQALERSDVAVLVIDASQGITAQDTHVAGYVLEAGKGMVVAANKWDLVEKGPTTTVEYTTEIQRALQFADYVPLVFISALTGQRVTKVLDVALTIEREREKRVATSIINQAMQDAFASHPPPISRGKSLKLLYVTQAGIRPPTFIFFVNDPQLVHFSYMRYLENQIRARFGFEGTPIRLVFKPRSEA